MSREPEAFEDKLPFKDRGPDEIGHFGISPTAADELGTITGDRRERESVSGRPAEYRLILQSMRVPGLPERVDVGRVRVFQVDGPLWTQRTHIVQRPGWRPVYEKWMEHSPVGAGYRLTVAVLPVTLAAEMSASLVRWRDEALAAVSLLVSFFDERVAQIELAEDVIAENSKPGEKIRVFDTRTSLREFTPASRVREADREALAQLTRIDTGQDGPLLAAGISVPRKAAQLPTPSSSCGSRSRRSRSRHGGR